MADIVSNLQAWWPYTEGSGTSVADASGHSKTLTLTNGPTWGAKATGPNGLLPYTIYDGTDDYGTSSAGAILRSGATNDLTFATWLYINAAGRNDFICWKNSDGSGEVSFYCSDVGGGITRLTLWLELGGVFLGNFTNGTDIQANTWIHAALTKNGNTWTFWKNGVTDGSSTIAATLSQQTTDTLWIGSNHSNFVPNASLDLNGRMADTRIYNRGLSAADMVALTIYDPTPISGGIPGAIGIGIGI